ncbi:small integral membrane protein 14-like [Uloborus diversus]|uniref:small integral membrane protein 14-like n=1 Tax=Uloborus diversus TaxID=327109 RepID=UPI002409B6E9|nr:small integral membrane protein 14-like [Uloborus diversus]XP_054711569.1 small integral membrane protein 14-like [Uloborus diversus]
MADDGFDPCECVFSHEGAMRRLIALLRNSQSYCTTEECFINPPGPVATQSDGSDGTYMMFAMGWFLLVGLLLFLRPASLSQRGDDKASNNQGPSQPPPGDSVQ